MYDTAPSSCPKQLGLSMLLMGVEQSEKGGLRLPEEETNPENQESDQDPDSEQTSSEDSQSEQSEEEAPNSPRGDMPRRAEGTRKLRPVVGLVPRKRTAEGMPMVVRNRPLGRTLPDVLKLTGPPPTPIRVRHYNQNLRGVEPSLASSPSLGLVPLDGAVSVSGMQGPRKRRSRPYQCDRCDYATTQSSHLVTHKRTHTGEKPFQCDICNFACSASCNLITHKRIHTGDKPYRCDRCNYACRRSFDLSRHKRTHTGEKPLRCDMCDYACCRASDLVSHRRIHTGEKPYKCEICGYSCSQSGTLSNHRKTHDRTYHCEICAFSCNKRPIFTAHAKAHGGEGSGEYYPLQQMDRHDPYLDLPSVEDPSRMYRPCPPAYAPVYTQPHSHYIPPFPTEMGPSVAVCVSGGNEHLMQQSLMDHSGMNSFPRPPAPII